MDPYFLSDNYLLRGATLGDVDSVHVICEFREFAAGESIVTTRDKNKDIMIMLEGRARVESTNGDLIDELRAGAMVGEISFIDGSDRTANVVSVGPSKVAVIPEMRMKALMAEKPKLEVTIYKNAAIALAQRLRETNTQLEALLVPR